MNSAAYWHDLVGLPWVEGECGPDAADCWGIARILYARAGIDLPKRSVSWLTECRALARPQQPFRMINTGEAERELDLVLMSPADRPHALPCHVGVIVNQGILHSEDPAGCVVAARNDRMLAPRIKGIARHCAFEGGSNHV